MGDARIVSHIHELELIIRTLKDDAGVANMLALSNSVIACSHAVAENLHTNHSVSMERISLVPEPVSLTDDAITHALSKRSATRKRLGINDTCFLVGSSGSLGWRKGSDAFLQLAMTMCTLASNCRFHFVWVGGTGVSHEVLKFQHDIQRLGLGSHVTLVETVDDPVNYYASLDAFVLCAREDPYPLVCLEAAVCGVPTVCFKGAGGIPEMVNHSQGGVVVPYLDVPAMASALRTMESNPSEREKMGSRARDYVRQTSSISRVGSSVAAVIEGVLSPKRS